MTECAEKTKLVEAYVSRVLKKGRPPASVYKLCKKAGVDEEAFYAHFSSLEAVPVEAWLHPLRAAVEITEADEDFDHYGLKDKLLALLYTTLEQSAGHRSFMSQTWPGLDLKNRQLRMLSRAYRQVVMPSIDRAVEDGTIARRGAGATLYGRIFAVHYILVIDFWLNDRSDGFERTDAFVEKTVNLAMELVGRQAFDSAIDLARFIASCRR